MSRPRSYPIPAAARRGRRQWTIDPVAPCHPFMPLSADSTPHTEIPRRRMVVPLDTSPASIRSRLHEMLHARLSPARLPTMPFASPLAVQCAEDIRIHLRGMRNRTFAKMFKDAASAEDAERAVTQQYSMMRAMKEPIDATHRAVGLTILSVYGTPQYDLCMSALSEFYDKADSAHKKEEIGVLWRRIDLFVRMEQNLRAKYRVLHFGYTRELAVLIESMFPEEGKVYDALSGADSADSRFAITNSGTMTWNNPPTSERLTPEITRPTVRHFDYGVSMRAPHRYAIDRAVFRQQRSKAKGGTILIDGSGSMRLTQEDLIALLRRAPAATIAIYSGDGLTTGEIRILAQNGRRVANQFVRRPTDECGNTIDAPACLWLTRQQEPRAYITDGEFFGKNEANAVKASNTAPRLRRGIGAMMCQGRITQYTSINRFLDAHKRKGNA